MTELEMDLYLIHHLKFQRPVYAPFKYVLQAWHTWFVLLAKRPRVVFVQDPPIFAGLVVCLYTMLTFGRARFVIDAHTGAFSHPWWKPFRWLQKLVYRRALTVITTNRTLTERVQSWRANAISLAGPPIEIPPGDAMALSEGFNLVLINTFSPDEPLPVVLQAVADQPGVHLYITGNVAKAPAALLANKPDNVTFTGFLPDDDYLKLLRGADAIMALTSRDFTLQLGGVEAVAVGKPLITTNWPFLQEHFSLGTVHVPIRAEDIRLGIHQVQSEWDRLSKEMGELQHLHRQEWLSKSQQLRTLVA